MTAHLIATLVVLLAIRERAVRVVDVQEFTTEGDTES